MALYPIVVNVNLELPGESKPAASFTELFCIDADQCAVSAFELARVICSDHGICSNSACQDVAEEVLRQVGAWRDVDVAFAALVAKLAKKEWLDVIRLDFTSGILHVQDQLMWDIASKVSSPEQFAITMCSDLGLPERLASDICWHLRREILHARQRALLGAQGAAAPDLGSSLRPEATGLCNGGVEDVQHGKGASAASTEPELIRHPQSGLLLRRALDSSVVRSRAQWDAWGPQVTLVDELPLQEEVLEVERMAVEGKLPLQPPSLPPQLPLTQEPHAMQPLQPLVQPPQQHVGTSVAAAHAPQQGLQGISAPYSGPHAAHGGSNGMHAAAPAHGAAHAAEPLPDDLCFINLDDDEDPPAGPQQPSATIPESQPEHAAAAAGGQDGSASGDANGAAIPAAAAEGGTSTEAGSGGGGEAAAAHGTSAADASGVGAPPAAASWLDGSEQQQQQPDRTPSGAVAGAVAAEAVAASAPDADASALQGSIPADQPAGPAAVDAVIPAADAGAGSDGASPSAMQVDGGDSGGDAAAAGGDSGTGPLGGGEAAAEPPPGLHGQVVDAVPELDALAALDIPASIPVDASDGAPGSEPVAMAVDDAAPDA